MVATENLTGKVAVVTGASSGIGAALSELMVAAGARVVLVARRSDRLNAAVENFGSDNAVALTGDINDPELAPAMLDTAKASFGRCDIVINNAASFLAGPIEKLDAERVSELARTNVEAAYRVAYCAARLFKSQSSGHLINISSIAGTKVARAGIGWYGGTKHALEALTESLRMELADTGVRVGCVEPGMTDTELFPDPITSIDKPLEAVDVAHAILYMLCAPPHVNIPRLMILPSCQPI